MVLGFSISQSQAIELKEIVRFDVDGGADPNNAGFYGSNPSAVAWSGNKLYVAGFNGATAPSVGITEITNIGATGLVSGTLGTSFANFGAPGSRGYSGLDILDDGSLLSAAYDDGAADPNGISAYNTAGNSKVWSKSARAGSGVGFDPGFNGDPNGAGTGWTTFGSGRRALQDNGTGADIFTTGNGMIINGAGTGTFWRDMEFESNGDIWLREGNNVITATRTGNNSVNTATLVVDEPEADFTNIQNIAYMEGALGGDFVIYNDRTGSGPGQVFTDVIKAIQPDGTPEPIALNLLAPVGTGAGAYDFSWSNNASTLAIVDFSNRNVHIFEVVPEPHAALLLIAGTTGLVSLGRRRRS